MQIGKELPNGMFYIDIMWIENVGKENKLGILKVNDHNKNERIFVALVPGRNEEMDINYISYNGIEIYKTKYNVPNMDMVIDYLKGVENDRIY